LSRCELGRRDPVLFRQTFPTAHALNTRPIHDPYLHQVPTHSYTAVELYAGLQLTRIHKQPAPRPALRSNKYCNHNNRTLTGPNLPTCRSSLHTVFLPITVPGRQRKGSAFEPAADASVKLKGPGEPLRVILVNWSLTFKRELPVALPLLNITLNYCPSARSRKLL